MFIASFLWSVYLECMIQINEIHCKYHKFFTWALYTHSINLFAKAHYNQRLLTMSRNKHTLDIKVQPPHMTFRPNHIYFS